MSDQAPMLFYMMFLLCVLVGLGAYCAMTLKQVYSLLLRQLGKPHG